MDQQGAARHRASSRGAFHKAHHLVFNNSTFIDGNHSNDRDLIDLLLSHTILGAEYDSSERYPPPSCHPGTRLDISGNIISWMRNPARAHKSLWLHGPAGVGKSAVIQTLAESEADSQNSILGATLFFSRPAERSDPQRVFNTIAYQLAVKYPPYRQYVVGLLAVNSRVVKKSLVEQFKWLIVKPFAEQKLLEGETILITLDGLDECEGESVQRDIILLITKFSLQHPNTPLIWIIASRPELHISSAFSRKDIQRSFLEIDMPVDSDQACSDVEHFLCDKFTEIREHYSMSFSPTQQWPTETQFVKIATRASGLFVFAETVVRFVEDAQYGNPVAQLDKVTDILDTCSVIGAQENPFAVLDALYMQILSGVHLRVLPITRKLLTLLTTHNLMGFVTACNILGINQADAYSALRKLHSVVQVPLPEQANLSLGAFHTSFVDYLQSPTRSGLFWIDPLETKRLWAASYVRILSEAHDINEAVVHTSSIPISWPFGGLKTTQQDTFSFALLVVVRPSFIGPEYFGKLDSFFQDIDYANLGPLFFFSSTVIETLSYFCQPELVPLFKRLEVFTTIPLESFNLGSVGSNGVAYIASDKRDPLPNQLRWHGFITYLKLWDSFFEPSQMVVDFYFNEVILNDEPEWTNHIHQHLTSMMNLLPSHPVRLLGKGQKTCAFIAVEILDRKWFYVLPYRQS